MSSDQEEEEYQEEEQHVPISMIDITANNHCVLFEKALLDNDKTKLRKALYFMLVNFETEKVLKKIHSVVLANFPYVFVIHDLLKFIRNATNPNATKKQRTTYDLTPIGKLTSSKKDLLFNALTFLYPVMSLANSSSPSSFGKHKYASNLPVILLRIGLETQSENEYMQSLLEDRNVSKDILKKIQDNTIVDSTEYIKKNIPKFRELIKKLVKPPFGEVFKTKTVNDLLKKNATTLFSQENGRFQEIEKLWTELKNKSYDHEFNYLILLVINIFVFENLSEEVVDTVRKLYEGKKMSYSKENLQTQINIDDPAQEQFDKENVTNPVYIKNNFISTTFQLMKFYDSEYENSEQKVTDVKLKNTENEVLQTCEIIYKFLVATKQQTDVFTEPDDEKSAIKCLFETTFQLLTRRNLDFTHSVFDISLVFEEPEMFIFELNYLRDNAVKKLLNKQKEARHKLTFNQIVDEKKFKEGQTISMEDIRSIQSNLHTEDNQSNIRVKKPVKPINPTTPNPKKIEKLEKIQKANSQLKGSSVLTGEQNSNVDHGQHSSAIDPAKKPKLKKKNEEEDEPAETSPITKRIFYFDKYEEIKKIFEDYHTGGNLRLFLSFVKKVNPSDYKAYTLVGYYDNRPFKRLLVAEYLKQAFMRRLPLVDVQMKDLRDASDTLSIAVFESPVTIKIDGGKYRVDLKSIPKNTQELSRFEEQDNASQSFSSHDDMQNDLYFQMLLITTFRYLIGYYLPGSKNVLTSRIIIIKEDGWFRLYSLFDVLPDAPKAIPAEYDPGDKMPNDYLKNLHEKYFESVKPKLLDRLGKLKKFIEADEAFIQSMPQKEQTNSMDVFKLQWKSFLGHLQFVKTRIEWVQKEIAKK